MSCTCSKSMPLARIFFQMLYRCLKRPETLALEISLGELPLDEADHVVDVLLPLLLPPAHALGQVGVLGGLEPAEAQVLQLGLDPADAEPVRQRRVDVQRLLRDALALVLAHVLQRPHVVGAVGELHQDDADVLRHRDDHLPEVLGLLLFLAERGARLELGELGHPVDQLGDLGSEELGQLVRGGQGVLDGVVEEPGDDARLVQLEVGQDAGHLQGVHQVRLSGVPELPLVHLGRVHVRLLDDVQIRVGMVGLDLGQDVVEANHRYVTIVTVRWGVFNAPTRGDCLPEH